MRLSEFNFTIPKSQIAKFPADPRDSSRLLVVKRETGELEDRVFSDIVDYLDKGDCLVVNETMVFPARLYGRKEKTNAKIEVLLLRELRAEERLWDALVEPARKVRIGNKIFFNENNFYAEVMDNTTSRGRTLRLSYEGDIYKILDRIGEMPLPNYIKREYTPLDKVNYQTIFANPNYNTSIAPPSAGLHFTKNLVETLKKKGVKIVKIVITLGLGAYEKIEVEDLTKHRMYTEYFMIPYDAAETINKSLRMKKKVVAVGSSVARALESSVLISGTVKPNKDWTDKFICPPYDFKIINALITNFHEYNSPSTYLGMAFAGKDNYLKAVKHALKNDYRFLVYGDAMLII
ncbi:MAG: S-adenosylmethionine:tRNA ribosyltransferase-isomerase [Candidatus Kapaibacterium sp.]|jgi:S-adenosylmethionine:tRNA ribosyltransferase-isomerase|nr:MAG: S-adenosylmethionine:tRNA ribosyltransferase-isomerase [Candidatus Kapabacteria bacterium]ROL56525.1 MAG: tRNA preQ1(34) S-adenosylmethionine ribosyltransferase-isomerase QueA [Bacteroidetes/Chlorobi group bacterium Naka2016]